MQRLRLREDAWSFLTYFRKTSHPSSWTGSYGSCWPHAYGIMFQSSLCPHFHWQLFGICTCCLYTQQRCNFTAFSGYNILGWNLYWSLVHLCTFRPRGGIHGWETTIVLPFQRCHSPDICSSYTPTNGRAERFNWTLLEKAEAIHQHACLPWSFWQDAVETALHIYNRQPCVIMIGRHPLNHSMETNLMFPTLGLLGHVLTFGYHPNNDKTSCPLQWLQKLFPY